MKLDMSALGIIDGQDKRVLEDFIDSRYFRQRKNYDEYYSENSEIEIDFSLKSLMIIAEVVKVIVTPDGISLEH